MKYNILIVEDEIITALDIKEVLINFGYNVIGIANSISKALKLLEKNRCDLALLDITLKNNEDGITLSEEISKNYNIPYIFLTANDKQTTIERVLKHKPYGYILKPFKDIELKVAVNLALEKFSDDIKLRENLESKQKQFLAIEKSLSMGKEINNKLVLLKYGYLFDNESKKLFHENKEIILNKKEIEFFSLLIKNKHSIVSKETIENYMYDGEYVGEGVLRSFLFRLRKKIDRNLIKSISGLGYKIEIDSN